MKPVTGYNNNVNRKSTASRRRLGLWIIELDRGGGTQQVSNAGHKPCVVCLVWKKEPTPPHYYTEGLVSGKGLFIL